MGGRWKENVKRLKYKSAEQVKHSDRKRITGNKKYEVRECREKVTKWMKRMGKKENKITVEI